MTEIKSMGNIKDILMERKLKDCPFCGGKAQMLSYSDNEWLVCCTVCNGMVETWRETEQEAIDQWNRRVVDNN